MKRSISRCTRSRRYTSWGRCSCARCPSGRHDSLERWEPFQRQEASSPLGDLRCLSFDRGGAGGWTGSDTETKMGEVAFADRVHMKVYWANGGNAVITSANLSDSALGVGGLHEVGVVVPASRVDIDRLIKRIKPRPVSPAALARLAKAERDRTSMR